MEVTVTIATNACEDAHFAMLPCCFLFFEHTSLQRQASVSSLLAPAFGVNCVSSLSDRWQRLSTSRCPCPPPSCHFCRRVLAVKISSSSCSFVGSQFPIQKELLNPHISGLLLPVFGRRGEAMLDDVLQDAGLGRVLCPCNHDSPLHAIDVD